MVDQFDNEDPYRIVAKGINDSENPFLGSDATNPNSSATGNGQFLKDTWLNLFKQTRPDLSSGKTDAQILAYRRDPTLSLDMTTEYAKQNAVALSKAGLPVTPGTLYASHVLGSDGAIKALKANSNAPLNTIVSGPALTANSDWNRYTTGSQLLGSFDQKVNANIAANADLKDQRNDFVGTDEKQLKSQRDEFLSAPSTNVDVPTEEELKSQRDEFVGKSDTVDTKPKTSLPEDQGIGRNIVAGLTGGVANLGNIVSDPASIITSPLTSLYVSGHDLLAKADRAAAIRMGLFKLPGTPGTSPLIPGQDNMITNKEPALNVVNGIQQYTPEERAKILATPSPTSGLSNFIASSLNQGFVYDPASQSMVPAPAVPTSGTQAPSVPLGTMALNALSNKFVDLPTPANTVPQTTTEKLIQSGLTNAVPGFALGGFTPLGLLRGAVGGFTGGVAGEIASENSPDWAKPGANVLGNIAGGAFGVKAPSVAGDILLGEHNLAKATLPLEPPNVNFTQFVETPHPNSGIGDEPVANMDKANALIERNLHPVDNNTDFIERGAPLSVERNPTLEEIGKLKTVLKNNGDHIRDNIAEGNHQRWMYANNIFKNATSQEKSVLSDAGFNFQDDPDTVVRLKPMDKIITNLILDYKNAAISNTGSAAQVIGSNTWNKLFNLRDDIRRTESVIDPETMTVKPNVPSNTEPYTTRLSKGSMVKKLAGLATANAVPSAVGALVGGPIGGALGFGAGVLADAALLKMFPNITKSQYIKRWENQLMQANPKWNQ